MHWGCSHEPVLLFYLKCSWHCLPLLLLAALNPCAYPALAVIGCTYYAVVAWIWALIWHMGLDPLKVRSRWGGVVDRLDKL